MKTVASSKGFTLMELMAVLVIVAILSALAMPIYSKYVRTAATNAAQAEMMNIAGQLEAWRARNLTYKAFTPKIPFDNGTTSLDSGSIAVAAGETIYIPKGSGPTNYSYQIALLDRTVSATSTMAASVGQSWTMIAQPSAANASLKTAQTLVLNSQGVRCKSSGPYTIAQITTKVAAPAANTDLQICGTPSLTW